MKLFWKIIRESIWILFFASLLSSIGGFGVEGIKMGILAILPLLILMPALNDMTGDYGIIITSRFTTMLFEGKIKPAHWWKSSFIHRLFAEVLIIGLFSSTYIAILSSIIAGYRGFSVTWLIFQKVLLVSVATTISLILLQFFVCIIGGFFVYRHKHDPDNYLIPLSTGIADLGSMLILSVLIRVLF